MAEITKMIKKLSQKFNTLQEDVNNLKKVVGSRRREKQVFSQVSLRVSDPISE